MLQISGTLSKIFVFLGCLAFLFSLAGLAGEFKKKALSQHILNVSKKYQPNYLSPQKFTSQEMDRLALEVLSKMEESLGEKFNRSNLEHIWALADFFYLNMEVELDAYSAAMTESDLIYFSNFEQFRAKELYPQNTKQLVTRFYWEGLARLAALQLKLRVVDNKFANQPLMSRGKVSDIATTAMFDKRPGISIQAAKAENRERYDFARLIQHLRDKGLAV